MKAGYLKIWNLQFHPGYYVFHFIQFSPLLLYHSYFPDDISTGMFYSSGLHSAQMFINQVILPMHYAEMGHLCVVAGLITLGQNYCIVCRKFCI